MQPIDALHQIQIAVGHRPRLGVDGGSGDAQGLRLAHYR
jgi:hypothetical protein